MANFLQRLFKPKDQLSTEELIARKTFVSFFFFFLFIGLAIFGWYRLRSLPKDSPMSGGIAQPLRAVMDRNEKIFDGLLNKTHLAKEYPRSLAVKNARVNGNVGVSNVFDTAAWTMNLVRNPGDTLHLKLEDFQKLPKTELVFNFKCIEGWSQITWWGGVRFSDFLKAYGLSAQSAMNYIGVNTPDKAYYVGIDMPSALHPQTLLCYELNGKPLPLNQGYPLRLIVPVKYGVKSLKRIGTLYFDNKRPPDYWAERGYDYFSGL